jgi:hypothetical protein
LGYPAATGLIADGDAACLSCDDWSWAYGYNLEEANQEWLAALEESTEPNGAAPNSLISGGGPGAGYRPGRRGIAGGGGAGGAGGGGVGGSGRQNTDQPGEDDSDAAAEEASNGSAPAAPQAPETPAPAAAAPASAPTAGGGGGSSPGAGGGSSSPAPDITSAEPPRSALLIPIAEGVPAFDALSPSLPPFEQGPSGDALGAALPPAGDNTGDSEGDAAKGSAAVGVKPAEGLEDVAKVSTDDGAGDGPLDIVPEPSTLLLVALGLGAGVARRRVR